MRTFLLAGALTLAFLVVPPAGAAVVTTCDGQAATIVGTEGEDQLLGTDGPDVIAGLGGDDHIDGLDGDDVICGGDGTDSLGGEDGNDTIYGGNGDDLIRGDTNAIGGPDNDRLYAGPGNDVLRSGVGSDLIDGGGGIDDLAGLGDKLADTLRGGDGDDRFTTVQPNLVLGGPGNDSVDYELQLVAGGRIDPGPGLDTRLAFVDHTGQPAVLNFRTANYSVGGFHFTIIRDEMRRLVLGGGRYTVIGRDVGEYVSALQLVKYAGHGGNDRLVSRSFDDTFLGGNGFDVAHVDGGIDTCRDVERREGCDR